MITLGDFTGKTEQEVKDFIVKEFREKEEVIDKITVIVSWVDDGGYDSSFFILYEQDGQYYSVDASHCSCYGYEDQWKPILTTKEFIKSDLFNPGYSTDREAIRAACNEGIK